MSSCWSAVSQAAHRAAYAQRVAEVTSPPTPWGDAIVSLLPTATRPYEVLRPMLSGELEMLVTLFLRRDLQIYYDRHLIRQPDGGVNAVDYPVEEVLARIVARTVQARGLGHESIAKAERDRRRARGEGDVNGSSFAAAATSPPPAVPSPTTFGRVASEPSSPILPTLRASTPIVVFVPGLSGGSKEPYVQFGVLAARRAGLRPVVYNPRGMGNTPLTTALPMCAAATGDFEVCLRAVKDAFPEAPVFACGWSLGANLVTRFAGEPRARELVDGVVSLCNPFDLAACCEHLETPRYFTYNVGLTKGLHGALAKMRDAFEVVAEDRVDADAGDKALPASAGAFGSRAEAAELAGTAADVAAAAEAAERQALAAGQAVAAEGAARREGADAAGEERFEGQDKGAGQAAGARDAAKALEGDGGAPLPSQGCSSAAKVSFAEGGAAAAPAAAGGARPRMARSKSYHSFLSPEETSYYQAMDRPPFPHAQRAPDVRGAMRALNMRAFDEAFTVPAFGYKDSRDYYSRASSAGAVARIRVPFLAVHARNDPIVYDPAVPRAALRANPYCVLIESPSGGHVGWTCRRLGWREGEWSDDVIPEFVKAVVELKRQGIKPTDTDQ